MEGLVISGYAAIAVALFTVLRLPLNRWTVPTAALGGVFVVFALIQVLNFYHPHSALSARGPAAGDPRAVGFEPVQLVAWFRPNQQARLLEGSAAEVTFDAVPGEVFVAEVSGVLAPGELEDGSTAGSLDLHPTERVPVLLTIVDDRYALYRSSLPGGSAAEAAVYGEDLQQLVVVRKTLLRMSAWMNYLTLPS